MNLFLMLIPWMPRLKKYWGRIIFIESESHTTNFRSYSLILVGKVSGITAKKDASNKMLNHITVEKLEYLVGFEDEDMVLKNYIVS